MVFSSWAAPYCELFLLVSTMLRGEIDFWYKLPLGKLNNWLAQLHWRTFSFLCSYILLCFLVCILKAYFWEIIKFDFHLLASRNTLKWSSSMREKNVLLNLWFILLNALLHWWTVHCWMSFNYFLFRELWRGKKRERKMTCYLLGCSLLVHIPLVSNVWKKEKWSYILWMEILLPFFSSFRNERCVSREF